MRRAALLVLLAGLVLGASACGEKPEPKGATATAFPVTVPRSGESPIVLTHPPTRLAACEPAASSLLSSLEKRNPGGPKVLDVTCAGTEGAGGQITAFHPDLVVASDTQEPRGNAPVYTISGSSIRKAEQGIVDVGVLLGRPLQARRILDRIRAQAQAVRRKVENLPRVSVFLDTGFYITVPTHSLAGQILSEAGGHSIAARNAGVTPFDLGLLRRKNPDYYLATSDSGVTLKELRKSPRTRALRAVRAGHFGIVPTRDLQAGPAIGDGIETVARVLHPHAFR